MGKRRALVSVTDKTGVIEFCQGLAQLDYEIISTGGTLRTLSQAGVAARQVSEVTSMPEILDGRVKSLHPTIFGGILARRNNAADMDTLGEFGMEPIDIVAVNLHPFTAKPNDEACIEEIDIGGPALLRAAAKNHHDVYVIVDPADYGQVLSAAGSPRQADFLDLRRRLAAKVFEHTAKYDQVIQAYLGGTRAGAPGAEGTTASGAAPQSAPEW